MSRKYNYAEAFSRNIGWVTEMEQAILKSKRVAIAGLGGVGGLHLLSLARAGIGAFNISDLDVFELANFNRQVGATVSSLNRKKADVLQEMTCDINPEASINVFAEGINEGNIDEFLTDVHLFVDGFDFFVLHERELVFKRCAELGIPAITAAPLGMGASLMVFLPGKMSFSNYFCFEGLPVFEKQINFLIGLSPRGFQRSYLADLHAIDLEHQRVPSTGMGCQLSASMATAEAVKILLMRGKVWSAPFYQHFDMYRGKFKRGYMPFGNRNPAQILRRKLAGYISAKMSRSVRPRESEVYETILEDILAQARWAPSGDNTQPWRFKILGDKDVEISIKKTQSSDNVYEFNDGQPSLISAGFLLESIKLAASSHAWDMEWELSQTDTDWVFKVTFTESADKHESPLTSYIRVRSVDRGLYSKRRIDSNHKIHLQKVIDTAYGITWIENSKEKKRFTRLVTTATDIRLRIPETYQVHRDIIDWKNDFSTDRIPAKALGVNTITQKIMQWTLADPRRINFLNKYMAGTLLPRLEMDILPGLFSGAFFLVSADISKREDYVRVGQSLQRFWLTATSQGMVMQPLLAPICFGFYGQTGTPFTADLAMREKSTQLARDIEAIKEQYGIHNELVFMGRLGYPLSYKSKPRSLRRQLKQLMVG